jgi:spermidine synthase
MKKNIVIYFLFTLSGVAGLVYQVVWFKHLSYFLGNTSYSQSIVLATFMGGLAIGAWWWGKIADKSVNALKLFAWLEIGIAVYCFLYMPIFDGVKTIFISLVKSQGWASDSGIVLLFKFVVSSLTMLIPTVLMGGTLPVLVRFLSERISDVGKNVSVLYFINSLGAVIGTVLAGFFLLQTIGLKATVYVGATMDLLVGLVFLGVVYYTKQHKSIDKVIEKNLPSEKIDFSLTSAQYKIVLWVAVISGFCAMAYEVIWLRLLIPILSSTTYSFTIILAVFITGITLGSLLVYSVLPKIKRPYWFLGFCQFGIVISILLTLPFYEKIPYLIWSEFGTRIRTDGAYTSYLMHQFYYVFLVMILPTIFMGMSLPIASRIAVRKVNESGRKVGRVFALNTIGTVAGALLTGLVLIPSIGIKSSIEIILLLNLILVVFILFSTSKPNLKLVVGMFVVFIFSSIYYFKNVDYERWVYTIMMSEVSRKINIKKPPKSFEEFQRNEIKAHDSVLYYKEGVGGTVVVGKKDEITYLYTNGKGDANSVGDLRTQVLLGHTPLILHSKPEKVLVIGFGAGTTIGSVLRHSRVKSAEVAEISSGVIQSSVFFEHINQKPLEDKRLKVVTDDGVSALRLSSSKYDVIISQPSNPWVAGVGNLFTKEFFNDCKMKLNPKGYMAQWFSLYEMDDAGLELILRTAKESFAYVSLWQIGQNDILFLCSETPFDFNLLNIENNYKSVMNILNNIGLKNFVTFLSLEISSDNKLIDDYINSTNKTINTEDLPLLEYNVPKAYFQDCRPNRFIEIDQRESYESKNSLLGLYFKTNKPTDSDYFHLGSFHTLYFNEKLGFVFADKYPHLYLSLAISKRETGDYTEAILFLEKAVNLRDTVPLYYEELINTYFLSNQPLMAVKVASDAIKLFPKNAVFYKLKGTGFSMQNKLKLAMEFLEKAIYINPNDYESFNELGLVYGKQGQYEMSIKYFDKSIELNNKESKVYYNRGFSKSLLGDYMSAILDFDQAILLNEKYTLAYLARGKAKFNSADKEEGCLDFYRARSLGSKESINLINNYCEK